MNRSQKFRLATLGPLITVWGCAMLEPTASYSQPITNPDLGDLILYYEPPLDEGFNEIYTILQETAFFDDLVAELNRTYRLPQDIDIVFVECGEENAFYDPEAVEVNMCYELLRKYADIFAEEYQGNYSDEVILAGHFTFLHELGHALVDQYQLPIIAREEDVVDSFATILLLQTGEEDAVIAGIEQFDVDAAEDEEFGELPFWGEHSLSIQRLYNIACLAYGSDPTAYADFVGDDFLPEERAEQCPEEYEQAAEGWQTLLTEFIK
ncbi:MAG: DUF4344 domain-containing metallopeptidase [Leptolyngbya sp. SIO1E4]|nr:DUF4344 domain-containing metallopeptidase [Leptolyngbya sp. SIO1E4]